MSPELHVLACLGLGFVFTSLGPQLIALEREALAGVCGGWVADLPPFGLKLLGLAAAYAGAAVVLPGLATVPAALPRAGGAAMVLVMAVPAIQHLRRREPLRLAANLVLALVAQAATGALTVG